MTHTVSAQHDWTYRIVAGVCGLLFLGTLLTS